MEHNELGDLKGGIGSFELLKTESGKREGWANLFSARCVVLV